METSPLFLITEAVKNVQSAASAAMVSYNRMEDASSEHSDTQRTSLLICSDVEVKCLDLLGEGDAFVQDNQKSQSSSRIGPSPRVLNMISSLAHPIASVFSIPASGAQLSPTNSPTLTGKSDVSPTSSFTVPTHVLNRAASMVANTMLPSSPKLSVAHMHPITDIIALAGDDPCPPGYTKITHSITGAYPADLNASSGSRQLWLAVSRNLNQSPITGLLFACLEYGEFPPQGFGVVRRVSSVQDRGASGQSRHANFQAQGSQSTPLLLCITRAPGAPILDIGILFPKGQLLTKGNGTPGVLVSERGALRGTAKVLLEDSRKPSDGKNFLSDVSQAASDLKQAVTSRFTPHSETIPKGYSALTTTFLGSPVPLTGGSMARSRPILVFMKDTSHIEFMRCGAAGAQFLQHKLTKSIVNYIQEHGISNLMESKANKKATKESDRVTEAVKGLVKQPLKSIASLTPSKKEKNTPELRAKEGPIDVPPPSKDDAYLEHCTFEDIVALCTQIAGKIGIIDVLDRLVVESNCSPTLPMEYIIEKTTERYMYLKELRNMRQKLETEPLSYLPPSGTGSQTSVPLGSSLEQGTNQSPTSTSPYEVPKPLIFSPCNNPNPGPKSWSRTSSQASSHSSHSTQSSVRGQNHLIDIPAPSVVSPITGQPSTLSSLASPYDSGFGSTSSKCPPSHSGASKFVSTHSPQAKLPSQHSSGSITSPHFSAKDPALHNAPLHGAPLHAPPNQSDLSAYSQSIHSPPAMVPSSVRLHASFGPLSGRSAHARTTGVFSPSHPAGVSSASGAPNTLHSRLSGREAPPTGTEGEGEVDYISLVTGLDPTSDGSYTSEEEDNQQQKWSPDGHVSSEDAASHITTASVPQSAGNSLEQSTSPRFLDSFRNLDLPPMFQPDGLPLSDSSGVSDFSDDDEEQGLHRVERLDGEDAFDSDGEGRHQVLSKRNSGKSVEKASPSKGMDKTNSKKSVRSQDQQTPEKDRMPSRNGSNDSSSTVPSSNVYKTQGPRTLSPTSEKFSGAQSQLRTSISALNLSSLGSGANASAPTPVPATISNIRRLSSILANQQPVHPSGAFQRPRSVSFASQKEVQNASEGRLFSKSSFSSSSTGPSIHFSADGDLDGDPEHAEASTPLPLALPLSTRTHSALKSSRLSMRGDATPVGFPLLSSEAFTASSKDTTTTQESRHSIGSTGSSKLMSNGAALSELQTPLQAPLTSSNTSQGAPRTFSPSVTSRHSISLPYSPGFDSAYPHTSMLDTDSSSNDDHFNLLFRHMSWIGGISTIQFALDLASSHPGLNGIVSPFNATQGLLSTSPATIALTPVLKALYSNNVEVVAAAVDSLTAFVEGGSFMWGRDQPVGTRIRKNLHASRSALFRARNYRIRKLMDADTVPDADDAAALKEEQEFLEAIEPRSHLAYDLIGEEVIVRGDVNFFVKASDSNESAHISSSARPELQSPQSPAPASPPLSSLRSAPTRYRRRSRVGSGIAMLDRMSDVDQIPRVLSPPEPSTANATEKIYLPPVNSLPSFPLFMPNSSANLLNLSPELLLSDMITEHTLALEGGWALLDVIVACVADVTSCFIPHVSKQLLLFYEAVLRCAGVPGMATSLRKSRSRVPCQSAYVQLNEHIQSIQEMLLQPLNLASPDQVLKKLSDLAFPSLSPTPVPIGLHPLTLSRILNGVIRMQMVGYQLLACKERALQTSLEKMSYSQALQNPFIAHLVRRTESTQHMITSSLRFLRIYVTGIVQLLDTHREMVPNTPLAFSSLFEASEDPDSLSFLEYLRATSDPANNDMLTGDFSFLSSAIQQHSPLTGALGVELHLRVWSYLDRRPVPALPIGVLAYFDPISTPHRSPKADALVMLAMLSKLGMDINLSKEESEIPLDPIAALNAMYSQANYFPPLRRLNTLVMQEVSLVLLIDYLSAVTPAYTSTPVLVSAMSRFLPPTVFSYTMGSKDLLRELYISHPFPRLMSNGEKPAQSMSANAPPSPPPGSFLKTRTKSENTGTIEPLSVYNTLLLLLQTLWFSGASESISSTSSHSHQLSTDTQVDMSAMIDRVRSCLYHGLGFSNPNGANSPAFPPMLSSTDSRANTPSMGSNKNSFPFLWENKATAKTMMSLVPFVPVTPLPSPDSATPFCDTAESVIVSLLGSATLRQPTILREACIQTFIPLFYILVVLPLILPSTPPQILELILDFLKDFGTVPRTLVELYMNTDMYPSTGTTTPHRRTFRMLCTGLLSVIASQHQLLLPGMPPSLVDTLQSGGEVEPPALFSARRNVRQPEGNFFSSACVPTEELAPSVSPVEYSVAQDAEAREAVRVNAARVFSGMLRGLMDCAATSQLNESDLTCPDSPNTILLPLVGDPDFRGLWTLDLPQVFPFAPAPASAAANNLTGSASSNTFSPSEVRRQLPALLQFMNSWGLYRHHLEVETAMLHAATLCGTKSVKRAMAFLRHPETGLLRNLPPKGIAAFVWDVLLEFCQPEDLGDYLGEEGSSPTEKEFCASLRVEYLRRFNFTNTPFTSALRTFLTEGGFRLPGEAQKIDRLTQAFASVFFEDNKSPAVLEHEAKEREKMERQLMWLDGPDTKDSNMLFVRSRRDTDTSENGSTSADVGSGSKKNQTAKAKKPKQFPSEAYANGIFLPGGADVVEILAFSAIMLNTDAHNTSIKKEKKMTRNQFINNNRGIDAGGDLPSAFLSSVYVSIAENEIKMTNPALVAALSANSRNTPTESMIITDIDNPYLHPSDLFSRAQLRTHHGRIRALGAPLSLLPADLSTEIVGRYAAPAIGQLQGKSDFAGAASTSIPSDLSLLRFGTENTHKYILPTAATPYPWLPPLLPRGPTNLPHFVATLTHATDKVAQTLFHSIQKIEQAAPASLQSDFGFGGSAAPTTASFNSASGKSPILGHPPFRTQYNATAVLFTLLDIWPHTMALATNLLRLSPPLLAFFVPFTATSLLSESAPAGALATKPESTNSGSGSNKFHSAPSLSSPDLSILSSATPQQQNGTSDQDNQLGTGRFGLSLGLSRFSNTGNKRLSTRISTSMPSAPIPPVTATPTSTSTSQSDSVGHTSSPLTSSVPIPVPHPSSLTPLTRLPEDFATLYPSLSALLTHHTGNFVPVLQTIPTPGLSNSLTKHVRLRCMAVDMLQYLICTTLFLSSSQIFTADVWLKAKVEAACKSPEVTKPGSVSYAATDSEPTYYSSLPLSLCKLLLESAGAFLQLESHFLGESDVQTTLSDPTSWYGRIVLLVQRLCASHKDKIYVLSAQDVADAVSSIHMAAHAIRESITASAEASTLLATASRFKGDFSRFLVLPTGGSKKDSGSRERPVSGVGIGAGLLAAGEGTRRLLHEGDLVKVANGGRGRQSCYRVFLFNDIILYASKGAFSDKYTTHQVIPLVDARVETNPPEFEQKGIKHGFLLVNSVKPLYLVGATELDAQDWCRRIREAIASATQLAIQNQPVQDRIEMKVQPPPVPPVEKKAPSQSAETPADTSSPSTPALSPPADSAPNNASRLSLRSRPRSRAASMVSSTDALVDEVPSNLSSHSPNIGAASTASVKNTMEALPPPPPIAPRPASVRLTADAIFGQGKDGASHSSPTSRRGGNDSKTGDMSSDHATLVASSTLVSVNVTPASDTTLVPYQGGLDDKAKTLKESSEKSHISMENHSNGVADSSNGTTDESLKPVGDLTNVSINSPFPPLSVCVPKQVIDHLTCIVKLKSLFVAAVAFSKPLLVSSSQTPFIRKRKANDGSAPTQHDSIALSDEAKLAFYGLFKQVRNHFLSVYLFYLLYLWLTAFS